MCMLKNRLLAEKDLVRVLTCMEFLVRTSDHVQLSYYNCCNAVIWKSHRSIIISSIFKFAWFPLKRRWSKQPETYFLHSCIFSGVMLEWQRYVLYAFIQQWGTLYWVSFTFLIKLCKFWMKGQVESYFLGILKLKNKERSFAALSEISHFL